MTGLVAPWLMLMTRDPGWSVLWFSLLLAAAGLLEVMPGWDTSMMLGSTTVESADAMVMVAAGCCCRALRPPCTHDDIESGRG